MALRSWFSSPALISALPQLSWLWLQEQGIIPYNQGETMSSLGALAGFGQSSDIFSDMVPLIPPLVCLSVSLRVGGVVGDSSLCTFFQKKAAME